MFVRLRLGEKKRKRASTNTKENDAKRKKKFSAIREAVHPTLTFDDVGLSENTKTVCEHGVFFCYELKVQNN